MTWKPMTHAYVFTTLFGNPIPVGVVQQQDGLFSFGYAKSWLSRPDAYPLDPLNLPLVPEVFESRRLFGPLADSLPDNWGQKVILATHKQQPANDIEWLLATRGRGVGALAYSASRARVGANSYPPELADLERVLAVMGDIEASRPVTDPELLHLVKYGSSFGGARPKTVIRAYGREWLAKLTRSDDTFDQVGAEGASLAMARDAGIVVPDFHVEMVAGQPVLLVERFDRSDGAATGHYLSAESVLSMRKIRETDFRGNYSYQGLSAIIQKISEAPRDDQKELFRRMAFNVAIGNTDDHLKNHGFMYRPERGWRLAPGFDLLPHPGQTAEHAIGIGTAGRRSTLENALSRVGSFQLGESECLDILEQVLAVTSKAETYFADYGVPEGDARVLVSICRDRLGQAGWLSESGGPTP